MTEQNDHSYDINVRIHPSVTTDYSWLHVYLTHARHISDWNCFQGVAMWHPTVLQRRLP